MHEWEEQRVAIKSGESPAQPALVYYDGHCRLCIGIMRCLKWVDRAGSLEFRDTGDDAARQVGLTPADLARSAYLVAPGGRVFEGFYAFRWLVLLLPPLWPLAPLAWMPGAAFLGTRFYRWVAGRRATIFRCGRRT